MSQQEQEERPPEEKKPEDQPETTATDTRSIFERVKERRAKRQERESKRKQYNTLSMSTGANEYSAKLARTQAELDELKILYSIKREIDELLLRRKESLRSESLI